MLVKGNSLDLFAVLSNRNMSNRPYITSLPFHDYILVFLIFFRRLKLIFSRVFSKLHYFEFLIWYEISLSVLNKFSNFSWHSLFK